MATKKKPARAKKKAPPRKSQKRTGARNSPFPRAATGQPNWHGLSTPDDRAAASFYEKVLGMKSETQTMGTERMILLKAGSEQVAHIASVGPGETPRWVVFFYVPDVDKAAKLCGENGGQISAPPMDIPPGRIAFLKDPAGAEFALFKPREV